MTELPAIDAETGNQDSWGGVTDPTHHDPGHFRYLLHLDSGKATSADPSNPGPDEVWEYAVHDPDKLKSLPFVSASLVDETHRLLYQGAASNHGFILEAPKSAVIATCPMDMFSGKNGKTVDELRATYPTSDPDVLLAETKQTEWNEVLISPDDLVIKAVFWVNGEHDDEPDIDRTAAEAAAQSLGLPFLELDLIKH